MKKSKWIGLLLSAILNLVVAIVTIIRYWDIHELWSFIPLVLAAVVVLDVIGIRIRGKNELKISKWIELLILSLLSLIAALSLIVGYWDIVFDSYLYGQWGVAFLVVLDVLGLKLNIGLIQYEEFDWKSLFKKKK